MCNSLRVVLLISQRDILDVKMSAFCGLAKTTSKLFADFATASASLAIWANQKDEDKDVSVERLTKMLKKAAKEKASVSALCPRSASGEYLGFHRYVRSARIRAR